MPTIIALVLTRFRKGAEMAASWLVKESYEILFLDLPKDLEISLRSHIDREAFIDARAWRCGTSMV